MGSGPGLCSSIHSSLESAIVPLQATSLIRRESKAAGVGCGDGVRVGVADEVGEAEAARGVGDSVGEGHSIELGLRGVPATGAPAASTPVLQHPVKVRQAPGPSSPARRSMLAWEATLPAGQPPPSAFAVSITLPEGSTNSRLSPLLLNAPV